jgi:hypothetical protein
MKTPFDLIQYLIDKFKYTSYLEIGVRQNENKLSIDHINCSEKTGVDIENRGQKYVMSSDQFFNTISLTQKYDIIFVDGDHEKNQVYKDILNSLNHLNENGFIVCHDINPLEEFLLAPRYCNNAWEAFAKLRSERTDLEMYSLTLEAPGVGIIRRGSQKIYDKKIIPNWEFLNSNRQELLNLIDINTLKILL